MMRRSTRGSGQRSNPLRWGNGIAKKNLGPLDLGNTHGEGAPRHDELVHDDVDVVSNLFLVSH
jgi:hypothetical protein